MKQPSLFDPPKRPVIVAPPAVARARPTLRRAIDGDTHHLVHDCGLCGAPNAAFGFGCSFRAVEALDTTTVEGRRAAQRAGGVWLCRACRDSS